MSGHSMTWREWIQDQRDRKDSLANIIKEELNCTTIEAIQLTLLARIQNELEYLNEREDENDKPEWEK